LDALRPTEYFADHARGRWRRRVYLAVGRKTKVAPVTSSVNFDFCRLPEPLPSAASWIFTPQPSRCTISRTTSQDPRHASRDVCNGRWRDRSPDTPRNAWLKWADTGWISSLCDKISLMFKLALKWPKDKIPYGYGGPTNSNTVAEMVGLAGGSYIFLAPPGSWGWVL
jgi:hypothetical protein